MTKTQTATAANGTTIEFRGVSSIKELAEAVADGFATIVGGEFYAREGSTKLVQVSYTTRNFEALSTMLVGQAAARRMGVAP
jgi:hypothetical protein